MLNMTAGAMHDIGQQLALDILRDRLIDNIIQELSSK